MARFVRWSEHEYGEEIQTMIGLELSVRSDEGHRMELLQTLENLCTEQLTDGSSAECRVFEDLGRPNVFLWLQWWRSEQQLEEHLRSVAFRTLLGAVKVLGGLDSARIVGLQDSTSVMGAFLTDRVEPGAIQT
jgi:quinol monooxygenase YgiN